MDHEMAIVSCQAWLGLIALFLLWNQSGTYLKCVWFNFKV